MGPQMNYLYIFMQQPKVVLKCRLENKYVFGNKCELLTYAEAKYIIGQITVVYAHAKHYIVSLWLPVR